MEVNHPKGVDPAHLLIELAKREEEEGLVLLSQAEVEGEADVFAVTLGKYIITSV